MQNDIVAIKLAGGFDFKTGVIESTDECPRIQVWTLLYGKTDHPLVHSRKLGLLFRDPPSQTCAEILAENDTYEEYSTQVNELWSNNMPVNMVRAEMRKLSATHRNQVSVGTHQDRINSLTGFPEPYSIVDLRSSPEQLYKEELTIFSRVRNMHYTRCMNTSEVKALLMNKGW